MPNLQEIASESSGVGLDDAFAIDEVNLYERLGHDTFVTLSTKFYTLVYNDDENPWFKEIFAKSKMEDAIRNQYEFFIQRMGGPRLYSERRGHPALIARHSPFEVSKEATIRWLQHMKDALDHVESLGKLDQDSRRRIWNFCQHTAWFLQAGHEVMKERRAQLQP